MNNEYEHTLRPIGERILVRRGSVETTDGGIIIPDEYQREHKTAEVLRISRGIFSRTSEMEDTLYGWEVREGDTVLLSDYTNVSQVDVSAGLQVVAPVDIAAVLADEGPIPVGDYVHAVLMPDPKVSEGGVDLLPSRDRERMRTGAVFAVGVAVRTIDPDLHGVQIRSRKGVRGPRVSGYESVFIRECDIDLIIEEDK